MSAELEIAAWWIAFGGTHIVGSSVPVRTRLIKVLGLVGFKAVYSLVALATFIPLCWVYASNKHSGSLLWGTSPARGVAAWAIMLLAFVVLLQGLLSRNPMVTAAELGAPSSPEPRGIQRVTRHPMNAAFLLFGVAHSLVNPWSGDIVFFGGFVVYSVLSAWHQDRRVLAVGSESARNHVRATSAVPFGAILTGRQPLRLGETSFVGLVLAIVAFILVLYFHGSLFGGFGG